MNSIVIKPIKTEADYDAALKQISSLMDAEAGTHEADELEVLATLVKCYEAEHYPIDLPDPIAAIRFRMEQLKLSQRDLIPYIGSRSKVSEVLSGKRSLTLQMIRSLHQNLGIPAEVLLKEQGATLPDNQLFLIKQIQELMQGTPTQEECQRLFISGWWELFTPQESATLQLNQPRLCMPMAEFHAALEVLLGRQIRLHEFSNKSLLMDELKTGIRPSWEDVIW
jgi:antitoxin component HigA of HigAB toxin-antitoxin module